MPVSRKHCVVLDTSILPSLPSIPEIKKFLDEKLKIDMTTVKSLQLHNIKNVINLVMHNEKSAVNLASKHNLKHCMECNGIKRKIPIYVDGTAVDMRIHDLPEKIDNLTVMNHMSQYGHVFSIQNEIWKHYFPGINNGVRIVRMQILKPIPSYIAIEDEITSVTHFQQGHTCENCSNKSHPKFRGSEARAQPVTQSNVIRTSLQHQQLKNAASTQQQIKTSNTNKQWSPFLKPPTAPKHNKEETKCQRSIKKTTENFTSISSTESVSGAIIMPDVFPAHLRKRGISYSWIDDAELRKHYLEKFVGEVNELISQCCYC